MNMQSAQTNTNESNGIRAEAHSDDRVFEVSLNAVPWFQQASEQEVLNLARCGWGGGEASDLVVESFIGKDVQVDEMFGYLHLIRDSREKKDQCGFECTVNKEDALSWLARNRPTLAALLSDADECPPGSRPRM